VLESKASRLQVIDLKAFVKKIDALADASFPSTGALLLEELFLDLLFTDTTHPIPARDRDQPIPRADPSERLPFSLSERTQAAIRT
jgi:hypothetical protein